MKRIVIVLWAILCHHMLYSQNLTQVIRGKVIDKQTQSPLIGATVVLVDSDPVIGTATDESGWFRLENVPVGRHSVLVRYVGYDPAGLSNLIVTSAKELVISVHLEEQVNKLDEVTVKGGNKNGHANNLAAISGRSFTVDETNRYAGSWGDPSRMVAGYGGVVAVNDGRNDIIIRGNSPVGLIWKLEGVQIPNPNHFATSGTTGGPVSILNNNTLSNSDFLTGAFPAEYGNGISGAFDLKLRSGNNEKREYIAQVSFMGMEVGAEGPLSKNNNGSYLINYRYSTLGFFDEFDIVGEIPAVPKYQDLCFKFDLPTKHAGRFTLFGIGGLSKSELIYKEDYGGAFENDLKKNINEAGYSNMGVMGLSNLQRLSEKGYIKTTIAVSGTDYVGEIDTIMGNNQTKRIFNTDATNTKLLALFVVNNKFNSKNTLRSGVNFEHTIYDFYDEEFVFDQNAFRDITNSKGQYNLIAAYSQLQHRLSDRLSVNPGVHVQFFSFNSTYSVEPRFSMRWEVSKNKSVNFGTGLYSQIQPFPFYLYETQNPGLAPALTNKNLKMTKSLHVVAGYDHSFTNDFRLKAEAYYQNVYNIPVEQRPSYFSMVNVGADFEMPVVDSLINKGTGENYGIELTLEKFFSNNYYFLVTASIYHSKYKGSDGVLRNTVFNGNYSLAALGGYEFKFRTNHAIVLNTKISVVGNKRQLPIDLEASKNSGYTVYDYTDAYKEQLPAYIKTDLNVGYRLNRKNVSHHFLLDITNIFNRKNVFTRTYDSDRGEIVTTTQYPMIPNFIYKVEF